jgi:DNA-directed RNA polymerase subunit D
MDMITKKENQIVFHSDIDESLANAIRRYINQIPVLAIDEVEIIKNGSALYDEVVAHRLGLVPIKTDKISEKTQGKLKLASKKEGMVNSGELKGNVDVVYENIPVTFLDKGQEIELVASARVGKGGEHVKFSPGLMFYRNPLEITVDKECAEEIKKICPNLVAKEKGDKIVIEDEGSKEVCDVCEGVCELAKKKAEVKEKEGLIITAESFGQLDVKDMIKKAAESLKKDLADVSKKVK